MTWLRRLGIAIGILYALFMVGVGLIIWLIASSAPDCHEAPMCKYGDVCVDGDCEPAPSCDGVECPPGKECELGACFTPIKF